MTEITARRFPFLRVSIGLIIAAAAVLTSIYVLPSLVFAVLMLSHRSVLTEVRRVESPDHLLDSVVVQDQPGFSIEPDTYRVYVTPVGSKRLRNPVLEEDGAKNLKVTWLAPKLLEISYTDGCIDTFHNHWSSTDLQNGNYDVEIRLKIPGDATPRRCD